MTIGRTDDPERPSRVSAFFRAARLFGTGSRNPSGPAVMVPRQQGRTHERNRPARQNLASALEPKGAVHTGLLRSLRVARPRFNVLLLIHLTPLRRNSSAYGVSQSTVRRGNASLGDDGYDRALKKRAAAAGLDAALFSWH